MEILELKPQIINQRSFYGKATVKRKKDKKVLFSYSTKIAIYENGYLEIVCHESELSNTTMRHLREFINLCGLEGGTKKEILAKYYNR